MDPWKVDFSHPHARWGASGTCTQRDLDSLCSSVEYAFHKEIERGSIEVHRTRSPDAATRVPDESLDFVYIDADHRAAAVSADLRAWWPKLRQGGVLFGDDYGYGRRTWLHGVTEAVDRFCAEGRIDLQVLPRHQFLIRRPRSRDDGSLGY